MLDEERYFLFNKDEDFPENSLYGLAYEDGALRRGEAGSGGVFLSGMMDSLERGCVWRRVRAGCDLPEALSFTFYCSDNDYDAKTMDGIIRAEMTLEEKRSKLERFRRETVEGGADFVLRAVNGRYLVFTAELYGDLTALRYIQVWCREEDFHTRYLPEIYHSPGSFLDRYIRIFASQYLDAERRIDRIRAYFDPVTAPDEVLRRLAEFMGVDYPHLWETEKLRVLLADGACLRGKGTVGGLVRLIGIFTGHEPLAVESFRMLTGIAEHDAPYSDCSLLILIPGDAGRGLGDLKPLHLIIQAYLPAGADYSLRVMTSRVVLSRLTFLGVNSYIAGTQTAYTGAADGLDYLILGE